jgi:hypothetical protein
MAKHRAEKARWVDELRIHIFYLKNKWYFFTKPKLKAKINTFLKKIGK